MEQDAMVQGAAGEMGRPSTGHQGMAEARATRRDLRAAG